MHDIYAQTVGFIKNLLVHDFPALISSSMISMKALCDVANTFKHHTYFRPCGGYTNPSLKFLRIAKGNVLPSGSIDSNPAPLPLTLQ